METNAVRTARFGCVALLMLFVSACDDPVSTAGVFVQSSVDDLADLTIEVTDRDRTRVFNLSDLGLRNEGNPEIRNAPRASGRFPVSESGVLSVTVEFELDEGETVRQTASFRARPDFRWAIVIARSRSDPTIRSCRGLCASVRVDQVPESERGAMWLWWDGIAHGESWL